MPPTRISRGSLSATSSPTPGRRLSATSASARPSQGSPLQSEQYSAPATRDNTRTPTPARQTQSWSRLAGMLGVGLLVAVAVTFLALPIVALLMRVPLGDLAEYASRPIVRDALWLSLFTSA